MGISLALATQQPINALHLALTQIAFFHWLPVCHTSFSETVRRAVCLERRTGLRKFQGLPTHACVCVLWWWKILRLFGLIGACKPNHFLSYPFNSSVRSSFSKLLPISDCYWQRRFSISKETRTAVSKSIVATQPLANWNCSCGLPGADVTLLWDVMDNKTN